jgi:Spy/CpxP family protein refolding chaperone
MMPPPPGAILDFIAEHAADLKLTDEQKAKFAELKKKVPAEPPKPPMNDPALKDLMKKVRDAMKSGDKDAADAARKELADKMKALNPEGAKLMDEIKATLTADQLAKFKELWKAQAPKGGHGGQGGGGQGGGGHGGGAPLPPDF